MPREADPCAPISAYRSISISFYHIRSFENGKIVIRTCLNTKINLLLASCRYHSLCAYMGDDDMFSSDLSDDQLKTRLGHMANTPCQV